MRCIITTNNVQGDDCIRTIFENDWLFEKIAFENLRWWTKCIILSLVQITLCIHLCMVIDNSDQMSGQMKFEVTPPEMEAYATIKSFRERLILERPIEHNIFDLGFPIITANDVKHGEIKFYGLHGEAKYIGPYSQKNLYSNDGYNGQMTFLFHPDCGSIFWIGLEERGHRRVINYRNFVEVNNESKICTTFQIDTIDGIYNIEMTNGCMFIKQLLHRWGSTTRRFDLGLPKHVPEEAGGADRFAMVFHREQPCRFEAVYFKGREIIHSIPLKKVDYESLDVRPRVADLTIENFNGDITKIKTLFPTLIQQVMQYYQETNRIYPLKTKIKSSKNDNGDIMWLLGETFTYDVDSKRCYIVNGPLIILLTKDNAQFYVDGSGIMILVNLTSNGREDEFVVFKSAEYSIFILNDAKKCGALSDVFVSQQKN